MKHVDSVYTHGYHGSVVRAHNNRTVSNSAQYMLDELVPGRHLLDVGSGVGTITADFARRLQPGRVTALELNETALSLTRAEIEHQGLPNVDFVVGDVHALDWADGTFDIVHAHQVLQHVADPVQALREMARVARPGGVVAVRESDYGGFIWYPQLPELDQWMSWYQAVARMNGGEPNAGRRLLTWAREAGLTDVACGASTSCWATPETRSWWGGMWAERIVSSRIGEQLLETELATPQDLQRVAKAWLDWAAHDNAWMAMVRGEMICRV